MPETTDVSDGLQNLWQAAFRDAIPIKDVEVPGFEVRVGKNTAYVRHKLCGKIIVSMDTGLSIPGPVRINQWVLDALPRHLRLCPATIRNR